MARPFPLLPHRWHIEGRSQTGKKRKNISREGRQDNRPDPPHSASGRDALEHQDARSRDGSQQRDHRQDSEEPQDTATQREERQAEQRPRVQREDEGRRGSLHEPSRQGGGRLHRREIGMQALNGSQTVLPLRPGSPTARSWDHKRNGTMGLFAKRSSKGGKEERGGPPVTRRGLLLNRRTSSQPSW